ncbi:MAG: hypothetical protein ACR2I1_05475, partial [Propionibacteriaceae bacterium]
PPASFDQPPPGGGAGQADLTNPPAPASATPVARDGAAPAAAAATPGQVPSAPVDLDQLVDALESRLVRELERRGGRFAGVF